MRQVRPAKRKLEPLLGGLALVLLLVGCVVVLRPFLSALIWAIVLSFSLYPLQRVFTRWFRGGRTLAACLVTLTVSLVLVGPVLWIGITLAEDGKDLASATRRWFLEMPDEAPGWVSGVPVLGEELSGYWEQFAESRRNWVEQLEKASQDAHVPKATVVPQTPDGGVDEAAAAAMAARLPGGERREGVRSADSPKLVVLIGRSIAWARTGLISLGLAVGNGVVQVLVSAFLAFFMLRDAQVLSERLGVAVDRLTGGRGKHLMQVAGMTVKGVIYGILGTALVQALVAGVGFAVAGVPGAVLLSVLTFFFALIPMGPPIIWIPAALWLFSQGMVGWGVFMVMWGIFAISGVDNILRPYLISQGSKLPFVLIFCGVIGGAVAFGFVGVFLGPTLLAVSFRLIEEWSRVPMDEAVPVALGGDGAGGELDEAVGGGAGTEGDGGGQGG